MNKINLNAITPDALDKIYRLDETFIGTPNYLGVAYFWHYDYRYILRELTPAQRVKVHTKFLKAGLPVNGNSPEHYSILSQLSPVLAPGVCI